MIYKELIPSMIMQDITIPLISIPLIDILLCKLFGTYTRWFQLHAAINGIIVYIIYKDIIKLFQNPLMNIDNVSSKIDNYFVMFLHIYHLFIADRLTSMDWFHHIMFIGGGCLPTILLYKSNLVRLGWFACCGLPGFIEYLCLALVKHNKLSALTQKNICSYIYNWIRYPITIYCATLTYIAYISNITNGENGWSLTYISFILFFNGGFYNKLTIENYIIHKLPYT